MLAFVLDIDSRDNDIAKLRLIWKADLGVVVLKKEKKKKDKNYYVK